MESRLPLIETLISKKAVEHLKTASEANKRFGARLFVSALVKKICQCQEFFMVGDNCI